MLWLDQIVVEKWLTDAEYDLAVSEKLLTWQYQDPVEALVAEDDSMQGVVKPETAVEPVRLNLTSNGLS